MCSSLLPRPCLQRFRTFYRQGSWKNAKNQEGRDKQELSEVQFPYKIVDKKRKPGLKAKATITKVQLVKAVEIFKDKAKDPEQELYTIHG
jgi:hypothetical protein